MQCDPLRGRNDTSKVRAGTMRLSPHHMTDAPCVSLLLLRRVLASRAAHRSPCLICSSRRRQAQRFSLNLCQLALRHAPPAARPAKPPARFRSLRLRISLWPSSCRSINRKRSRFRLSEIQAAPVASSSIQTRSTPSCNRRFPPRRVPKRRQKPKNHGPRQRPLSLPSRTPPSRRRRAADGSCGQFHCVRIRSSLDCDWYAKLATAA